MLGTTTNSTLPHLVLIAEDDPDDRLIMMEAWKDHPLGRETHFVEDGAELLEYLFHVGRYPDPATSPRPGLILLDLNMPNKNGHQVLAEIQAHSVLKNIPVVIMTSSMAANDMTRSNELGAAIFLHKPVSLSGYQSTFQTLHNYMVENFVSHSEGGGHV